MIQIIVLNRKSEPAMGLDVDLLLIRPFQNFCSSSTHICKAYLPSRKTHKLVWKQTYGSWSKESHVEHTKSCTIKITISNNIFSFVSGFYKTKSTSKTLNPYHSQFLIRQKALTLNPYYTKHNRLIIIAIDSNYIIIYFRGRLPRSLLDFISTLRIFRQK